MPLLCDIAITTMFRRSKKENKTKLEHKLYLVSRKIFFNVCVRYDMFMIRIRKLEYSTIQLTKEIIRKIVKIFFLVIQNFHNSLQ